MKTLDSLTVKDYMSTNLVTFTPAMEMMTVINTLVQNRISGGSFVADLDKVIGFIPEKALNRVLGKGPGSSSIGMSGET